MAEHLHKSYSCDRCMRDLGEAVPEHYPKTKVSAVFEGEWAMVTVAFAQLCDPCHEAVWQFFGKPMP